MIGFEDVLGQEKIKEYFKTILASKKISHAYIIQGEKGMGKERVAEIFANTLQCTENETKPCGMCHSCLQAKTRNHPDIIYISHEKPNSIGVNDIRLQINQDVAIKPYSSDYKVYIVPEAEKMTAEAQNALLKTLEEPPSYVIILLLVTNVEQLFQTIVSRSIVLDMKPINNHLLKQFLMEEEKTTDYKADLCVAFARGNIGKARKLAQSEEFEKIKEQVISIIKYIDQMTVHEMFLSIKNMMELKLDMNDFFDILLVWYRDVLLFKATNDINALIFKDEIHIITKIAGRSSYAGIETIINSIDLAKQRMNANVNMELTIELLLLTIQENG